MSDSIKILVSDDGMREMHLLGYNPVRGSSCFCDVKQFWGCAYWIPQKLISHLKIDLHGRGIQFFIPNGHEDEILVSFGSTEVPQAAS